MKICETMLGGLPVPVTMTELDVACKVWEAFQVQDILCENLKYRNHEGLEIIWVEDASLVDFEALQTQIQASNLSTMAMKAFTKSTQGCE